MHGKYLTIALACFGSVSFAATPVASVSAAQPVILDGHAMSAKGIAAWPLVIGDEVATSTSPAEISFKDGSRITLAAQSDAKIAGTSAEPVFLLVSGSLDYKLPKNSKLSVAKLEPPAAKSHKPAIAMAAAASAAAITPLAIVAGNHSAPSAAAASSTTGSVTATTATSTAPTISNPALLSLPPVSSHL